ncbi:Palmitoyltransferase PFA4 [Hirsutella minnesotensis 3608]|nr:Palmitoyltransferase PFA4 [Hirsutella minnesotensis 3608]
MAGFNDAPLIQHIAVPAVCLLIAFLSYFSQYLFHCSTLDPGPPSLTETIIFNGLLLCLWLSYYKAVTVDPGRYVFHEQVIESEGNWCKKCVAPKPPRAHHCRHCGRCVPKMDHHCPWTRNCVSMTTFPHFLRFLVYANLSLWTLARLLWQRFYALWEQRHLPAYLGPSLQALIALALASLVCFVTTLALGIMLVTTVRSWLFNCTMIEGWELDRHEAIIDRGGRDWWDVTGPEGRLVRFERVEFPYDIGLYANMSQAMGTYNFLLWFFPLAGNPTIDKAGRGEGWQWEENGFNRKEGMWPPVDPEKIRRTTHKWPATQSHDKAQPLDAELDPAEQKRAFMRRQQEDARRRNTMMAELEEVDDYETPGAPYEHEQAPGSDSDEKRGWVNSDGERLRDYGVDEEAEDAVFEASLSEDEVPLGELVRRRRIVYKDKSS